eukprot:CAMPEP_0197071006 /NCGR_PEP_ID=MMETSP1384-20130603/203858_1 /TAXON_ID=29189 /ORGANISM="Ammonia sp." /LENGTH=45 /DNA_ID= /DNA_START= /DNA_END= /DNA_ORIENTATION=
MVNYRYSYDAVRGSHGDDDNDGVFVLYFCAECVFVVMAMTHWCLT